MVKEIRISNMYSIKDEIVLDMTAGSSKSKNMRQLQSNCFDSNGESVLKSVAIYGANASGKSNIIKAIRFCCMMILNSHNHTQDAVFNFLPFKYEGYPAKESTFFIRFVTKDIEYEYSFSMTTCEIVSEELYYYPRGRRATIFTRNERLSKDKHKIYHFTSVIKRPMDVAVNTSRKTLFVSRASQMDRDVAKDIYLFFKEYVLFSGSIRIEDVEKLFYSSKSTLLEALRIADCDITDIKLKKEKVKNKNINADFINNTASINEDERDLLKFTTFHRNNENVSFDLNKEESSGTVSLFYNMLYIIDIVRNGKLLLWDEIEQSLHSKIVEYIFSIFNKSKSAQLICTTHNTNLLDLGRLRKDQIYFVNKKEDGSSDLYSLYDYKDFRENMDLEKAYLQGRFDAIPYINDSQANINRILSDEEN